MEENNLLPENEIMEDVINVTVDRSNKGIAIAIGLGVTALVGGVIYKKVIKPRMKAKSNSEDGVINVDFEDVQKKEEE